MSLSVFDVATIVAAGATAASRLISVTQAWWSKLPRWAAVLVPVLIADLPQIAAAFNLVQTGTSLTSAIVVSIALLLPGIAEAEKKA